ncbi:hypothetical protein [Streptomyces carpaticus]|uniref:Uncharacterized protein n=1 Tax=Streptomyces carpaticus TaxID=285558 RepID=A0ABV4ZLR5_9ACTN
MARPWEADPSASFAHRLGRTAQELGLSQDEEYCPEMWQLDNGDVAVIGRDVTTDYAGRLPDGVKLGPGERLVMLPGSMLSAAKPDIPDA